MTDSRRDIALPTASLATLRRRAELLAAIREFFHAHDYWEVETPALSRESVIDAHLDPFVAEDVDGTRYFLQTSPEFGMKRLLAAGAEAIFQITRAYRRGETGALHNPEFCMLEWYRTGDTHVEQMEFTESLVRHLVDRFSAPVTVPPEPFERIRYDDAFARWAGHRVLTLSGSELRAMAAELGVTAPPGLTDDDRDEWLNLLLNTCIERHLGVEAPVFLVDYPESQAALAVVRKEEPPVAERFELYVNRIEVCNGYHELTDVEELRRRNARQLKLRRSLGLAALPEPHRFVAALEQGLPPSAGVALGVDRLALLLFGGESLADVLPFPGDRA